MMKFKFISVVVCVIILISSCTTGNISMNQDKLVVWISGVQHLFSINTENESYEENVAYPSKHTYGSRLIGGEMDCVSGNVFAQAIWEYAENTGTKIEIQFIEDYAGQSNKLQEAYEKGENLPDLVVVGKKWGFDYERLAEQGMLLDLSAFISEEDDLLSEENYYQKVLQGGEIMKRQYVMPILFNMNAVLTSQSYLNSIEVETSLISSYDDVISMLKQSCIAMASSSEIEAIYEASGNMIGGQYLPSILLSAAYADYSDEENDILVEETLLCSILELMQLYMLQELVDVEDWQDNTYLENINEPELKSRHYQHLSEDAYEGIGLFLTGGRSGGMNFHNSLLTDAAYFNSVYQENDEELVLCGIPTKDSVGEYNANISLLAFGCNGTNHPEEVYSLIRFLMDYEYPTVYGFSVNKENTRKQLMSAQQETEIYPDDIWSGVYGGFNELEELESQIEKIAPLDDEYVEIISQMLNNIGGGGLPCPYLEHNLSWNALNIFLNGEMSKEETAQWIREKLEIYIQERVKSEPFYDERYDSVYKQRIEERM